MRGESRTESDRPGPRREVYSVGYDAATRRRHERRTAAEHASFLLPYLRPGLRLLDCGCGSGSITVGLARIVGPGQAIGVDLEPGQLERARELAAENRVPNVSLAVANVYDLPFPNASFDAVFAHTLLEHLREPLQVLREMRRVLKPGGVAAVRDPDYGTALRLPSTPMLEKAAQLLTRLREHVGGSPTYALRPRRLLREAGFVRVYAFAFAECQGSPEATRALADLLANVLEAPTTVGVAVEQNWADLATLAAMAAELRAWGEGPDAFRSCLDCAAVGWVEDRPGDGIELEGLSS
jgi:SAM-dependent methyltransferase